MAEVHWFLARIIVLLRIARRTWLGALCRRRRNKPLCEPSVGLQCAREIHAIQARLQRARGHWDQNNNDAKDSVAPQERMTITWRK